MIHFITDSSNYKYAANNEIKKKDLFKLSGFIVRENYLYHRPPNCSKKEFERSMWPLYLEDLSIFDHSIFFVVVNEGTIVGSVKVTRWNNTITLPIQQLFNVNLSQLIAEKNCKSVWHIGRLAIAKEKNAGAQLLRKLITLAIYPICMDHGSMMVAECDGKFANVLPLMGIRSNILGPAIHYLGSPTVPIYSSRDSLLHFLKKSPHLGEVIETYDRITGVPFCLH